MYYINLVMKNYFFLIIEYIYYLSLVILLILYLYPGSLLGYFFYGNLDRQPILIESSIGSSINHFISFSFLSILAIICNLQKKFILNNFLFLLFVSILLEILHIVIPNRAFEFYDLIANVLGVLIIILLERLRKWLNY